MQVLSNSLRKYIRFSNNESDMPVGTKRIPLDKALRILAIADTHGCLEYDDLEPFKDESIDVCLILGDLIGRDLKRVKECIGVPIYGVVGNHNDFGDLDFYGFTDIHGKVVNVKGVTIAGWRGSIKYKDVDFPSFTDDESKVFAKNLPKADILISHDSPKFYHGKEFAHSGLQGISDYLKNNMTPLNLHGHHHEPMQKVMEHGTLSICVHKCQLIDISELK